jgi:hypothetical protein
LDIAKQLKKIEAEITRLPVRNETIAKVIETLAQDIGNVGRATWTPNPKKQDPFPHLRHLTAPLFIKEVWKDWIENGRISK